VRLGLLQERHWSALDKLGLVSSVTQDAVSTFAAALRSKLRVTGFVQGNMTRTDASALERVLLDKLGCTAVSPSVLNEVTYSFSYS
jgi:secreted Zn-dependent insulinase-like peptidase